MGVNLVPIVRNFSIETIGPADSDYQHSIDDGCITPGTHKVMRFDFLTHNKGNTDLDVGNPADHPDWYVLSASHGHYHLIDFNEFLMYDADGNPTASGAKQAFCLIDVEKIDPAAPAAKFSSCMSHQGVSAGWADLYDKSLACQYVVVDGLADGDYTLMSTTNAQKLLAEDTFDDNTICTGLHLSGNSVSIIDPPIGRQLITNSLNFNDVPAGETTARAVVVEFKTCRSVTIRFQTGPTVGAGSAAGTIFERLGDTAVSLPATNKIEARHLRLWVTYKGTNAGDIANGNVVISCDETGNSWTIPIGANTISRPTVGVTMVLDQSGSMLWNSGLASVGLAQRNDVLKFAAPTFVELIQENNGIGIVAFDSDAFDRMPVTKVGPPIAFDPARVGAKNAIAAHTPNINGRTSIGDGIENAHNLLLPVSIYDHKAIIVLTDGFENEPKYIADIQSMINERVFAIGLGTAEEINPVALTQLTNNTGGYLLLTGSMGPDNLFRLSKYYLQILAGVTNQNIVRDPEGFLTSGTKHRIPFILNETDITTDVILLSAAPPTTFSFVLETPNGDIIDLNVAAAMANIDFVQGTNTCYYRITLPAVINGLASAVGTWNAILSLDDHGYKKYLTSLERTHHSYSSVQSHGIRYSLSVHSLSNLRMDARIIQTSLEPGATLHIRSLITEYGQPLSKNASVNVEIQRPDNTNVLLPLNKIEAGVFEEKISAVIPGIYHMRVLANGITSRNKPFTREQLLTGAVWKGGNNPLPNSSSDAGTRDEQICRFLDCLFGSDLLSKYFEENKINQKTLQKCIHQFCKSRKLLISEAPPLESK